MAEEKYGIGFNPIEEEDEAVRLLRSLDYIQNQTKPLNDDEKLISGDKEKYVKLPEEEPVVEQIEPQEESEENQQLYNYANQFIEAQNIPIGDSGKPIVNPSDIGLFLKQTNPYDREIQDYDADLLGDKWLRENPNQKQFEIYETSLSDELAYTFREFADNIKLSVPAFLQMAAQQSNEYSYLNTVKSLVGEEPQDIFDDETNIKLPRDKKIDIINMLQDAKKAQLEENRKDVEYMAWMRYAADTPMSEWGEGVWARSAGRSVSNLLLQYLIPTGAAIITRNPNVGLVSSLGLGYLLEGSNQMSSSIDYLMQGKEISLDEYNKKLSLFRNTWSEEYKEQFGEDISEKKLKLDSDTWTNNNFDMSQLSKGIIKEYGHSKEEAYDIAWVAANTYAVASTSIEFFPGMRIMKRAAGVDRKMIGPKTYRASLFSTILNKTSDATKRIAQKTGLATRLSTPAIAANVGKTSILEGATEWMQYNAEVAIETIGPAAYKSESFSEVYDYNTALESFVGGMMGGGIMSLSTDIVNKSGAMQRVANFSKKMYPGRNTIVVKKDDDGRYKLVFNDKFQGVTIGDPEVRNQLLQRNFKKELLRDEQNNEISYSNFREASEVASQLTDEMNKFDNQIFLHKMQSYIGGEVKIEQTSEGKFQVNAYNKEGKFINTIETADTKVAAKKTLKIASQNIVSINKLNEQISEKEMSENRFLQQLKQEESTTGVNVDVKTSEVKNRGLINNRDLNTDINILKAFNPDSEVKTEEENDVIDKVNDDYNLHEDSNIIKEIIEERGGNVILHSGQTPVEFLKEYEDTFGEDSPENVEAIRNILIEDELLPPSEMPQDNESTPAEKVEKEIELGPEGDAVLDRTDIPITTVDRDDNTGRNINIDKGEKLPIQKTPKPKASKKQKELSSLTDEQLKSRLATLISTEKKAGLPLASQKKELLDELKARGIDEKDLDLKQKISPRILEKLEANREKYIEIVLPKDIDGDVEERINYKEFAKELSRLIKIDTPSSDLLTRDFIDNSIKPFFDKRIVNSKGEKLFNVKEVNDPQVFNKGWYVPSEKTLYINTAYATKDTPFHEFAHPILEYMDKQDPKTFDKLYEEILNTPEGKKAHSVVKELYPVDYQNQTALFKHEVFAEALGYMGKKKYLSPADKTLWQKIVDFIKQVFGIKPESWRSMKADKVLTGPNVSIEKLVEVISDPTKKYTLEVFTDEEKLASMQDILLTMPNPSPTMNPTIPQRILTPVFSEIKDAESSQREFLDVVVGEALNEALSNLPDNLTDNDIFNLNKSISLALGKKLKTMLKIPKRLYKGKKYKVGDIDSQVVDILDNSYKELFSQTLVKSGLQSKLSGDDISPKWTNPLFTYSDDRKTITLTAEGSALHDVFKAVQFKNRVSEFLRKKQIKFSVNDINAKFSKQSEFGKESKEIQEFQKYLDKKDILNVDGKRIKSIDSFELAEHFDTYMAEKYPLFYESFPKNYGVEIHKIYRDYELSEQMKENSIANRVAFFDKATTLHNYFSYHGMGKGYKEGPASIDNTAPLFWYSYEKTHDGDIVLYEYQSDIFDKDVSTGLSSNDLIKDLKTKGSDSTTSGFILEKALDVYYGKSSDAVADMLKYGYRIPPVIKRMINFEFKFKDLIKYVDETDENKSLLIKKIVDNNLMPMFHLDDLRNSNKKELFKLLGNHAFDVFKTTGDFNKALNSYKDILSFQVPDVTSFDENRQLNNWENILHEFKVWSSSMSGYNAYGVNKIDNEMSVALMQDIINNKANKERYYEILTAINNGEQVEGGNEAALIALNENKYREISSRYQRIKTEGLNKEKSSNALTEFIKSSIINNPSFMEATLIRYKRSSEIPNLMYKALAMSKRFTKQAEAEFQKGLRFANNAKFLTNEVFSSKEALRAFAEAEFQESIVKFLNIYISNRSSSEIKSKALELANEKNQVNAEKIAKEFKVIKDRHDKMINPVVQSRYFDWIIRHSIINASQLIEEGKSIYLNTGASIHKQEHWDEQNDPFHIYKSPNENKWHITKQILMDDRDALLRQKLSKMFAKDGLEDKYKMNLGMFLDTFTTSGPGLLGYKYEYGEINPYDNKDYREVQDWLSNNIKNAVSVYKPTEKTTVAGFDYKYEATKKRLENWNKVGPWYTALTKIKNLGLEYVTPEWSSVPLLKVTKIPSDLTPTFYQKTVLEISDAEGNPQSLSDIKELANHLLEKRNLTARKKDRIFKNAWKQLNEIKEGIVADPQEFRVAMIDGLPIDIRDDFVKWFKVNFNKDKMQKIRSKEAFGESQEYFLDIEDVASNVMTYLNEMSEGLDDLSNKKQTNEKEIGINELTYFRELGINISQNELKSVRKEAHKIDRFEDWLKEVGPKYFALAPSKMVNWKKNGLQKYYLRIRSSIRVNTSEGVNNERDNFNVEIVDEWIDGQWVVKDFKIGLKGPEDKSSGKKNATFEKIMPFEFVEKGLFGFISPKDMRVSRAKKDEDGEYVLDNTGKAERELKERYGSLTERELLLLSKRLGEKDLAIAFMRGEAGKLGIVRITSDHKNKAKNADDYFDLKGVSPEMKEELMGKGLKFKDNNARMQYIAAEIAVVEAMEKVFPDYLNRSIANVYKRIKLPFTPATFSHEMEDIKLRRISPEELKDLRFVYNNKTNTDGLKNVKGVGVKYIADGGTINGRNIFEKFYKGFGLKRGTAKGKTVIYHNDGSGNVIAVKHQHSMMEKLMDIYVGDKRIAYTDKNGNLFLDNGSPIDMLATEDEIKILTGAGNLSNEIIEIPGNAIGFIKFDEHTSTNGKTAIQAWNHIYDRNLVSAFNQFMVPQAEKEIRKMILLAVDTVNSKSIDKQLELLKILENQDSEGYMPSALEMAKLGAGNHPSMAPVYNKLVQRHIIEPGVQLSKVPGSRLDFAPNFRGDLDRGEVALSIQNAKAIKEKYAEMNDMSLSDVDKLSMKVLNEWLADNPIYIFASRSPIPHVGGAMMARVKRLHGRKGLIEINTDDVFARFEGDFDGDELHIEVLPQGMGQPMLEFYDNIAKNLKGISLDKFVNPNNNANFSIGNRRDRFKIMEALGHGNNAMGEISNVQGVYGQMVQMIESIELPYSGKKIMLKQPTDIIKWKPSYYKDGKWSGNISDFLRIMLQAAFDNNEFMLLGEWNYNQDGLYRFLFKDEKGNPITELDFDLLRPLLKLIKSAQDIRNAKTYVDGQFDLLTTMRKSSELNNFIERLNTGIVGDLKIKKYDDAVMSPVQSLAILPYRLYQEYLSKYERIGENGTPFHLNPYLHYNAHLDAMERIDKEEYDMLAQALTVDGVNIEGSGAYIRQQVSEGNKYAMKMGKEFYRILGGVSKAGPQTTDRNEDFIAFKEQYNKEFKELSNTAQVAATIKFLKGVTIWRENIAKKKTKAPHYLPSASRSKAEFQLLDANVLSRFFRYYNEITNAPENRDLRASKRKLKYTPTMDLLKRFGC